MRKLIYYVATTVDGFIAAKDGSIDAFPQVAPHMADLISDFPRHSRRRRELPWASPAPTACSMPC
jgi:hypothetical protein